MKSDKRPRFKPLKKKLSIKYILFISALTFVIAFAMGALTDILLDNLYFALSFVILLAVILIGIVFDIVGVAATSASETPFHAMAADKVRGAKEALSLLKNAEKVSSVCNDVVGDVCGIVSGGISAFIIAGINFHQFSALSVWASVLLSGVVSALTVGGKAVGKFFAISNSNNIVFTVGKFFAFCKLKKK